MLITCIVGIKFFIPADVIINCQRRFQTFYDGSMN